jgi:MarR family transcriptional regulator, organic hydroperoxide resistance regulator
MEEQMAAPRPPQLTAATPATDLALLLTRADRLLSRRFTAILAASGCSLDAWRVISLLADADGHPMTELAAHVFLPPASLTKLMDHLVDDNLVYRRVDELDRRRIRAFLTPRGRALHRRLAGQLTDSLTVLDLPVAEQELLLGLLGRLSEALHAAPAPTAPAG